MLNDDTELEQRYLLGDDATHVNELLRWVAEDVLHKEQSYTEWAWDHFLKFFAFTTALISALSYYPLTRGFTDLALGLFDDSEAVGEEASDITFHTLAVLSISINLSLLLVEARNWYHETATNDRKYNIVRPLPFPGATEPLLTVCSGAFALASFYSIVLAYDDYLNEQEVFALAVAAWLGPFAAKKTATRNYFYSVMNNHTNGSTSAVRNNQREMKNNLETLMSEISKMKIRDQPAWLTRQMTYFMPQAFTAVDTNNQADEFLRFILKDAFDPGRIATSPPSGVPAETWLNIAAKGTGNTLGAITSIATYSLVHSAVRYIFLIFSDKQQALRESLKFISAFAAFLPALATTAPYTVRVFSRVFSGINDMCKASHARTSAATAERGSNKFIAGAVTGGVIATIPSAVLAYIAAGKGDWVPEAVKGLFAAAVFISYTATRSLSTADFLNMVYEQYENRNQKGNLNQRKNFLAAIKRIENALEKMPDEKITALYNKYISAAASASVPATGGSSSGHVMLNSYSLSRQHGAGVTRTGISVQKCTVL